MRLNGHASADLRQAAHRLAAGELLAFPTETVYGLGANAEDERATARIFEAKGRPADHPLIVHVADAQGARVFAREIAPFAQALMDSFWPGPLTVILPRRADAGRAAAAGQNSIGLRCPGHPVALALLRAAAELPTPVRGVAGPSANRFGRVSPTCAQHVADEFGPDLWVLDGGPCQIGIESTIVDCTRSCPVLLRPGHIGLAELERVCGQRVLRPDEAAGAQPRASGTLDSHYAPQASVRLMAAKELQAALDVLGADAPPIGVYARSPIRTRASQVRVRRMPDSAEETARQLFAVLREFDASGARLIWVESVPSDAPWDGVRDRLARAAAPRPPA